MRGPQVGPIPLKSGKTQRVLLVMMIILETVNDGDFIDVNGKRWGISSSCSTSSTSTVGLSLPGLRDSLTPEKCVEDASAPPCGTTSRVQASADEPSFHSLLALRFCRRSSREIESATSS